MASSSNSRFAGESSRRSSTTKGFLKLRNYHNCLRPTSCAPPELVALYEPTEFHGFRETERKMETAAPPTPPRRLLRASTLGAVDLYQFFENQRSSSLINGLPSLSSTGSLPSTGNKHIFTENPKVKKLTMDDGLWYKGHLDLPEDILVAIFLLLPLNRICQILSVCKQWNILVTARIFNESNLSCTAVSPEPPKYFLRMRNDGGYLVYCESSNRWKIYPRSFPFPKLGHNFLPIREPEEITIVASKGGVMLLDHQRISETSLMLFNPVSRYRRSLHPMPRAGFAPFYSRYHAKTFGNGNETDHMVFAFDKINSQNPVILAFNKWHSEGVLSERMATYDFESDSWAINVIPCGSPSMRYWCRDALFCGDSLFCWVTTIRDEIEDTEHYLFEMGEEGWQRVETTNPVPPLHCGSLFDHGGTLMLIGSYYHHYEFHIAIWKLDMLQLTWELSATLPQNMMKQIFRITKLYDLVFRVTERHIFFGYAKSKSRIVLCTISGFSWKLLPAIPTIYAEEVLMTADDSVNGRFLLEPSLNRI